MVVFSWSTLGDFSPHPPTPVFCNEYGLIFVVVNWGEIVGHLDVSRRIIYLLKRGQVNARCIKAKLIV